MNIKQCTGGHFYDADRYPSGCPYCQTQNPVSGMMTFFEDEAAQPQQPAAPVQEVGATMPVYQPASTVQPQQPAAPVQEVGATMPVYQPASAAQPQQPAAPVQEVGATMPVYQPASTVQPQQPAAPVQEVGATMPLYQQASPFQPQQPAAPGFSAPLPVNAEQPLRYREFFKKFASKAAKSNTLAAGIWAAITAAITIIMVLIEEYDASALLDASVFAILAFFLIWQRRTVVAAIYTGFVVLEIVLVLSQGVMPTWGTYLAIVTAVMNLIYCVKMGKAYKAYKESGKFPEKLI